GSSNTAAVGLYRGRVIASCGSRRGRRIELYSGGRRGLEATYRGDCRRGRGGDFEHSRLAGKVSIEDSWTRSAPANQASCRQTYQAIEEVGRGGLCGRRCGSCF